MSKRIDDPKIGDVYEDRSYAPGDRRVRIVEEAKDWRGRPAFVVEVVQHMYPNVVGRRTTVSATGIRTKYRKETAA